jgi:hypothetical protein
MGAQYRRMGRGRRSLVRWVDHHNLDSVLYEVDLEVAVSNTAKSTLADLADAIAQLRQEIAMPMSEYERYMYAVYHAVEAADIHARRNGRDFDWDRTDHDVADNQMAMLWPRKDQPQAPQLTR